MFKTGKRIKSFKKRVSADFYIYQMGKVASTSIEASLKEKYKIEHFHSMFSYLLQEQFNLKILNRSTVRIERYAELVSSFLRKRKKKVKVITLVREPISRNISMFFQDLHNLLYDEFKKENRADIGYDNFYLEFFNSKVKHLYFNEWFDKEIKRAFKIDVFEHPFDKEKGYSIIKEGNVEILVMKMEKLNDLEGVIRDFCEYPEFELKKINLSSNKWYSSLLKEFKKNFVIDEKLMEEIYNTKTVKHFYSEDEINKFKDKWNN